MTVANGVALTIEAGTVIKITGKLTVNGALKGVGTAEAPVTFTSLKDDSVGGDTNSDGSVSKPKPGDWGGLVFNGSSTGQLDYVHMKYGASISAGAAVKYTCPCASPISLSHTLVTLGKFNGIDISKGSPSITKSTISDNGSIGIRASSGAPVIDENTIARNGSGIILSVGEKEHGSVDIDGNTVEGNADVGIQVSAGTAYTDIDSASMGDNVLKENGGKAIVYQAFANKAESASFADNPVPSNIASNSLSGNGMNGIWVSGQVMTSTTWDDSSYAFVVFSSGLNIGGGSTLSLGPGAVIKNESRSIYVNGSLESEGTGEEPVTFTSFRDDSVGGDTNGDGSASSPAPGDWVSIEYPSAQYEELSYLDLRYAETAIDVKYLDSLGISNSDFVYNEEAIDVAATAENEPLLGALTCAPPYLSFVISARNWFGEFGYPAPSIDIVSVVGAAIPSEYAPLFGASTSLASLNASL